MVGVLEGHLRRVRGGDESTRCGADENEERDVDGYSASLHDSSMGHPAYNNYFPSPVLGTPVRARIDRAEHDRKRKPRAGYVAKG
ncbi:hypothetical protein GCM10027435_12450 [Haloparvum alkalitolerans]